MDRLTAAMFPAKNRPVKVLQFGEGNFLRAFVDYFIDIANEKTDFDGSVVLVKPITFLRVLSDTWGLLLSTRETVAMDTPARREIS